MGSFNLQSVKRWSFEPESDPTSIDLAAAAGISAVADSAGNLYLFSRRGKEICKVILPSRAFNISISSQGKYIGALCEDGRLRMLQGDGSLLWEDKLDGGICTVDINQRDGFVIVGSTLRNIYLYRLDGVQLWKKKIDFTAYDLCFAHKANGFAVSSTSGELGFFNYDGSLRWRVSIGRRCRGVDVSEDGRFIILPVYGRGIFAYNLYGDYIGEYDVMAEVSSAEINASGKLIYLSDEQNRLILLSKNAEVIWNLQLNRKVVELHTDNSGALCLALVEGGEIIFLQLVAEESPYAGFLEFPEESEEIEGRLLWKKSYKHLISDFSSVQTDLSPGGDYISVLANDKISIYNSNSLLVWSDAIEEANPRIYSLKDESFFFVNTDEYLYRYSYRNGREWKLLMKLDRLFPPKDKGCLYATGGHLLLAIDRRGEILWQRELSEPPSEVVPSADGVFVAVRSARSKIDVYNYSGGLAAAIDVPAGTRELCFFGSYLVTLKGDSDMFAYKFPMMEESYIRAPLKVEKMLPMDNYLVLVHPPGGATVLDRNWEKFLDLPDEKGRLFVIKDQYGSIQFIRIWKEEIRLYDRTGSQVWKFTARKEINMDTLVYCNGMMIFFAGGELYYLSIGARAAEPEIMNYLEFSSKWSA